MGGAWGWLVSLSCHAHWELVVFIEVCHLRLVWKTNLAKNTQAVTNAKGHSNAHSCPTPNGLPLPVTNNLPCGAPVANFNTPSGTHFSTTSEDGIARYNVLITNPDKKKEKECLGEEVRPYSLGYPEPLQDYSFSFPGSGHRRCSTLTWLHS